VQINGCNIAVGRADRNGSDRFLYGCDALALLGHMPHLKPVASRARVVPSFVRVRQILLAGSIAAP
jgi:hypothetical protein